MSAALIIVLVALGDGDDASTRAMTRTTEDVLGHDSVVLVREVPAMPDDGAASDLAKSAHATAVVELQWSADRREARLRVRSPDGTWTERAIAFQASDPPDERGRLLAFAVSSMVPPDAAVEERPPAAPRPAPSTGGAPPTDVGTAPKASPYSGFIGIALERASNTGLERRSVGGALRGAYVPHFFGVTLMLAMRSGAVDAALASSTTLRIAAGPIASTRVARWVALAATVEAGGVRVALDRPGVGRDARWLPSLSASVEMALGPETLALTLGVGVEHALGTTDVVVEGAHMGALPRTRALGGFGLRVRF